MVLHAGAADVKRLQDFADLAILGVAALLLPVNAWAISDGEWFATLQCGARTDVQPVRPPYSGVLPKWVIKDGRTDLEIRQPVIRFQSTSAYSEKTEPFQRVLFPLPSPNISW